MEINDGQPLTGYALGPEGSPLTCLRAGHLLMGPAGRWNRLISEPGNLLQQGVNVRLQLCNVGLRLGQVGP